jgi:hypothetical protein
VFRWDCNKTLDGTNYACVSIDDSHTFGITTQPTAWEPNAALVVGSYNGTTQPAGAIIEGFTVSRRVWFDGTYGVDIGNGDEINLIWAAGAGKDPTLVVGSWDTVFCLPTNQTAGAMVTGTGEAWSHPHSSAVLTDTWCETTYGSSAWSTEGTPSSGPSDITAAQRIFNWGYEWTTDAAAEGVSQGLTGQAVGQNYVLRVIAHCAQANDIRIVIWDDTNGAQIGANFDFGASSSSTAPGVAIFCFELPTVARNGVAANCTAVTVRVVSTASGQTIRLHQVELLVNLFDNPSLETGAGNPWIPDGWINGGLDPGDSQASSTGGAVIHSGSDCIQLNVGAAIESIYQNAGGLDDYVAFGVWLYGDGGPGVFAKGWPARNYLHSSLSAQTLSTVTAAVWTQRVGVFRTDAVFGTYQLFANILTSNAYLDDVYAITMDDISLTVTPASEVNSVEDDGVRIDGYDDVYQPDAAGWRHNSGAFKFTFNQRHAAADVADFGEATPILCHIWGDATNYAFVEWSAANTIRLRFNDGGGEHSDTWDATGAIAVDTVYTGEIRWTSTRFRFYVDTVLRIEIVQPVSFATVPTRSYAGCNQAGGDQVDAVFGEP